MVIYIWIFHNYLISYNQLVVMILLVILIVIVIHKHLDPVSLSY